MEIDGAAPNMTPNGGPSDDGPQKSPAAVAMIPIVGPTTIVPELLTETNYEYWSTCVKSYLVAQDLWEICTSKPEQITDPESKKKNAVALHAIQISCSREMLCKIMRTQFASEAWNELEGFAHPDLSENTQVPTENTTDLSQYDRLRDALERGNWNDIDIFLKSKPDAVRARISIEGRTPLHLAARAGNVEVVEKLVARLNKEDLEIIDCRGMTALSIAALSGITGMARHMIRKHEDLASILYGNRVLPVVHACYQGNQEMTRFLYSHTESNKLSPDAGKNGATLLRYCIIRKFLDIAMDILDNYPILAVEKDQDGSTPLYVLGQMTTWFKCASELWFWQRWIYSCITVNIDCASDQLRVNVSDQFEQSQGGRNNNKIVLQIMQELVSYPLELLGIKKIHTQKLRHGQANRMLQRICPELKNIDRHGDRGYRVFLAVIEAIKQGNIKFVTEVVKSSPELMWKQDQNGRDIFSVAVMYRQEKIFNFLPERPTLKVYTDDFGDTTLHLAAMLAPPNVLDTISGAALQMQRELRWFKEAERIMLQCKDHQNSEKKKPSEVFSEQHADLMKEGAKWMKDVAQSNSFVAALVVTITFAAAFTIPGGNNDKGIPIFLDNNFFMVFIVSDSISLFSAVTSVLMFLGILTSEYSEKRFLTRLPTELIIGLSFLFISLAAMMVAFCASLAILLKESSSKVVMLPIVLFACIPVALFVVLQFPLLVRICISTYGPTIFKKRRY